MDSPTARSLQLLALLQTGREWTVCDLSDRLGVSERTVRRDAMRLRDLGYEVRSRPGPGAAYALRPSVKIPPLLLDADEVTTIITSLLVLEAWSPRDASAAAARSKLELTLPPGLRRRAAATALSTQVLREVPAPVDWEVVGIIADAVATEARLEFGYVDQQGHPSRRTVEPYRHLLRDRRWYLIAYDLGRTDWRLFRLDRMQAPATLPGPHRRPAFAWDTVEEWLTSNFGADAPPPSEGSGQGARRRS